MTRARLLPALGLTLFGASAHAQVLNVTNVSVAGTSLVKQARLGSNGFTFVFDAATSAAKGNGQSRRIVLNYTITSDRALVGYQFSPLGTVFRGNVAASLVHAAATPRTDAYAWSSPLAATGVSSLSQPSARSLSGLFAYDVTATIDLATLAASPSNRMGIAAMTQYNISYQAVPEPASLAALALGGLALLRRRKATA